MSKTQFKMPPCTMNPNTEKPYTRHKWGIVPGVVKQNKGNSLYYYHVQCERPTCKLNSRNPVAY